MQSRNLFARDPAWRFFRMLLRSILCYRMKDHVRGLFLRSGSNEAVKFGLKFVIITFERLSSRAATSSLREYADSPECPPDVEAHCVQPEEGSQEEKVRHDR